MPDIGEISISPSGVDIDVLWRIDNFFHLSKNDGAVYLSPDFSYGGEKWYLEIYPNGRSRNDTYGHVDVRLWKKFPGFFRYHFSDSPPISQAFSLSLKTVKGEKVHEKHCTNDFCGMDSYHDCNRFIPRLELSRRRAELVPDGVLTVLCTMRNRTSAGSATEKDFEQNSETACAKPSSQTIEEKSVNDPEHTYVGAQRAEASIQTVEASTQTMEEKCKASASGSSTNSQEKKVLHDFKELFLKKEDCDVVIKVKGSEFPAHRLILKARSPVFASTFRHDMKENATGVVEIEDCDPSSFANFLCFLYCGDVGIISEENVFSLFTVADKYEILDLKVKCLEFMKKNMTVETFCETITLALRHSETELIKLSTDYFTKNASKIILTVKWQTFLAENPTESNELLVKLLAPNSK